MDGISENTWPVTDSLGFDLSSSELDVLLHTDWLSLDGRGYAWEGPPPDCNETIYEGNPVIPSSVATRESSTTSSSSIHPSYHALHEAQTLDDSSNYEITTGTSSTANISSLQIDADTFAENAMLYQNSPGTMSPDGLPRTTRLYEGDYITAKQRSLIHRRKQNRESQRTFRQRKELERIELQARLETTIKTCEELKTKVKKLEDENLNLRLSGWDLQAK